jgi:hypothetical protein
MLLLHNSKVKTSKRTKLLVRTTCSLQADWSVGQVGNSRKELIK